MKKIKKQNNTFIIMMSFVTLILLIILIISNVLAFGKYDSLLTTYFGMYGGTEVGYDTNQYFDRKKHSAEEASDEASNLAYITEGEGAVLLKNKNNALPLSTGNKVSCFSQSSVDFIYGVIGGSGSIDVSKVETLKMVLEQEKVGLSVNPILWNFYKNKTNYRRVVGGLAGGTSKDPNRWMLNEVPYSQYTNEVKSSYSQYNDAAIVVISRSGCENGDLPRDMSFWDKTNTGSILELDDNEKEMLKNVCSSFKKVIVLLNTGNPMECGFLDDYDIDACLWVGGVGQHGLNAVADILVGNINPSGRTVDTYAYDVFSAPAMQNWGNYAYVYNGKETGHHYVAYAEGIYVGYKYYETRYEDKIMNTQNTGNYNYEEIVQFPFGYGLSYTSFEMNNFSANVKNNMIEVSVNVKNVGNKSGKYVTEFYYQSPYTEYDKAKQIEKSSINLLGFVKTKELMPNEEQVVKETFDLENLKSYDAYGKKTYILEGSEDYYLTVADNAHSAINNILEAKGFSVSGNSQLTYKFGLKEKLYDEDTKTGTKISNLFEEADLNELTYLSRNNWIAMENDGLRYGSYYGKDGDGSVYKKNINEELKSKLELIGYEASGAPNETFEMPNQGVDGDLKLINLKNRNFNDENWDKLLNQVTVDEMVKMAKLSGFKTAEMKSIDKPYTTDADGPSAWNSFIGDGVNAGGFPYSVVLASTWNVELAKEVGDIMGELCLWAKINNKSKTPNLTGWYAPAMNIHRTSFGGRNFEYYSEDAILSAYIGSSVVKGATNRGVICYLKHFAVNEQETNRMTDNVVWINEQSLREIYLKPFEISVKEGGTLGMMTSYNRIGTIWAGGNYALLTGVLRNEWGFNGFIITDYMDGDYENVDQMLAAGGDAALNPIDNQNCQSDTAQAITYLRRATKHCLYAVVNSNAMNGFDGATKVIGAKPRYHLYIVGLDITISILVLCSISFTILKLRNKKMEEK